MLHSSWLCLWLWLWLGLGLMAPPGGRAGLRPAEEHRPTELVCAALYVLEHCVSPSLSALDIVELSRSELAQDLTMSYLLQRLAGRMAVQLKRREDIEEPQDYILFLLDEPGKFRGLRFHFATSLFDREFHFLIVLRWRAQTPQSLLAGLQEIFSISLSFHVLNAVVLVQPAWLPADMVLVYGYRLFAPGCNAPFTPELINRYQRGRLLEPGRLFGRPLGSFYGCPLGVSWYPLPPYVMFDGNGSDPGQRLETHRLTGIDGELIQLLARIFHFRLRLLAPCEKKSRSLRVNNSIEDCFEQLASRRSSVLIGAMSGSHWYRDKFSTSNVYHQSALVFVVRADQRMGAVNQLLQPFCPSVWLALILTCLSLLLLLQCVWRRRSERFDMTASGLRVHTTLLGNPLEAAALPRAPTARLYLGAWLLLALVQRAAYQGKLYDAFRQPYHPPVPEQIAQLLDGDYEYLMADYQDYFPAQRTRLSNISVMDRFAILEQADEHGRARLTTSALLGNLAHYNHLHWQTSRLTHVREHIYLYQLVMYLHRHSVLKFAFDRKLKQLQSAGIVGYMNRDYERSIYHVPHARGPPSPEVAPLRMDMLCGLLFICYLMLAAALLAFLLELASRRLAWLRRYLA